MKEYLKCPIENCDFEIDFENNPETALLEYVDVFNRFEKHLHAKHTVNQLVHALYHLAILTQFKKEG